MNETRVLDPRESWLNHQRIRFIKGFYLIRRMVNELFYEYEHSGEIGHERIDQLLESQIRDLKDLSHILYRQPDEQEIDRKKQRIFDKVFGEMWHELDKARDNIRLIEAYSFYDTEELPEKDKTLKALGRLDQQVLNAARRDLPYLLRRSKRIMDKLVPLFEDILGVYEKNTIIFRSLYFSRDQLDELCEPSVVDYFFPLIHSSVGKGYVRLLESLIASKHLREAEKVLQEFQAWAKEHTKEKQTRDKIQSIQTQLTEAKERM